MNDTFPITPSNVCVPSQTLPPSFTLPPLSRKAFEYDMPLRRLSADPLGEVLLYLRAKDVLSALLSCRHLRDVWRTRPDMQAC